MLTMNRMPSQYEPLHYGRLKTAKFQYFSAFVMSAKCWPIALFQMTHSFWILWHQAVPSAGHCTWFLMHREEMSWLSGLSGPELETMLVIIVND